MADVRPWQGRYSLGTWVKKRPSYGMEGGSTLPEIWGQIVYIHPQGRFYTLEFEFTDPRNGRKTRFRESYND